jgi:hypothetical protein
MGGPDLSGLAVGGAAPRPGLSGAAQAVGVAPGEAPGAAALVLTAELVTLGRIVARRGAVAHLRQFRHGEQL